MIEMVCIGFAAVTTVAHNGIANKADNGHRELRVGIEGVAPRMMLRDVMQHSVARDAKELEDPWPGTRQRRSWRRKTFTSDDNSAQVYCLGTGGSGLLGGAVSQISI
jgi:hypothetical protein